MLSKEFQITLVAKQTKYGQMRVVNFALDQWLHGSRIMIEEHIQHITKRNVLLLKDLLEP